MCKCFNRTNQNKVTVPFIQSDAEPKAMAISKAQEILAFVFSNVTPFSDVALRDGQRERTLLLLVVTVQSSRDAESTLRDNRSRIHRSLLVLLYCRLQSVFFLKLPLVRKIRCKGETVV